MARLILTVCLPPLEPGAVRQAIADAIAPYDHNGEGEDLPPGEWYAWWLGSTGQQFWIKPGFEDDPLLIREYETRQDGVYVSPPGRCSGGPVRLLDIHGQRSQAAADADALWCEWEGFSSGFPPARSLDDLIAEEPEATYLHAGPAWHRYAAQPVMRAVLDDPDLQARFGQRAVGDFGVGRDRYVRRKADESLVHDDLLTLDGEWISSDSMPHDEYVEFFNTHIDELPLDAVLVNLNYNT
ncbi:hypothetical protein O3Q52_13425 [Streptomyces sp. ActVer]|uniref:hypothetical protein n=1 Tax=Streptomyces sp. ActVer TaxID=3014558 RepID=UPI0022B5D53C|nr:hypothetical protein [Streptomyces sp. ActVer]MCZ4509186.1 hypothetical protein [Streptomyces sp. ActVer]